MAYEFLWFYCILFLNAFKKISKMILKVSSKRKLSEKYFLKKILKDKFVQYLNFCIEEVQKRILEEFEAQAKASIHNFSPKLKEGSSAQQFKVFLMFSCTSSMSNFHCL